MDDRTKKHLNDILISINSIDEHLQGVRIFKLYLDNKTMRRSVERELEIIGEALNRILKHLPDITISSARKIVGQRNLISHAYDSVDNAMIWGVVVKHLPILKNEVELLLSENDTNKV